MLRQGDWDGRQLISAEAVRQTTVDAGTLGTCGMGWWTNTEGRYERVPRDAFWGAGAQHQVLLVVPSLQMIAVRNGGDLGAGRSSVEKLLFDPLMAAVAER